MHEVDFQKNGLPPRLMADPQVTTKANGVPTLKNLVAGSGFEPAKQPQNLALVGCPLVFKVRYPKSTNDAVAAIVTRRQ